MKSHPLAALLVGLLALGFLGVSRMQAQDAEKSSLESAPSESISDRDQAGLRGPVRSVVEERLLAAWTDADGKVRPELKTWWKTEYDREGRTAVTWFHGSSRENGFDGSEFATRNSRNAAGQLLRTTREENGKTVSATVYRYDDQGRLESITDSNDPNNPIAFRYDANGRKWKIATAQPVDIPAGTGAVVRSVDASFEAAGRAPALAEGGSAVTLYDEHDRPVEIQAHNALGEIMFRTIRTYDDEGRIVEESETMDDPLSRILSADQRKIFASGEVSPEELRDQIAHFLGGSETWSVKYTYDAQGRKSSTMRKVMGHMEERIEHSYNEKGDVSKETRQTATSGTPNKENDGTESSETIYSYDYDSYGNWTVKKTSSRSLPDGTFKDAGDQVQRTIEYYQPG